MTAAIRKSISQASAIATTVSSINGTMGQTDGSLEPPQRSRNARAQARHRAKRKAYIEQLEETVTKLQSALHLTPDQVAAMPPAQARIRELEAENRRLRDDINDLRMQLQQYTSPPTPSATSNSNSSNSHGHTNGYSHMSHSRPHSAQVHSLINPSNRSGSHSPVSASTSESLGGSGSSGNYFAFDDFNDREKKRKRLSPDNETNEKYGHGSAYLTPGGTPPHHHDLHHVHQDSGNTYYNGYTNGHSTNHHASTANVHSNGNGAINNHTYLNSNGAPLNNSSTSSATTNGNSSHSKPPLSLSLPLPSFGQQSHSHPLQQQYIHGHSHTNGLSTSTPSSSLLSSHPHSHNGHTNGYLTNVSSTPTNTNPGSSAAAVTSSFSASISSLVLPSFPLPTPPLSSASSLLPPVFPNSSLPSPNLPLNPMSLPSPAPSPINTGGTSQSGAGSRITGSITLSNDKKSYYQNDHIYNNFSHNYSPHKPPSLSVTTSFPTSSVSSLSSASDPSDSFRSLPPHVPNFDRDRIQRDRHADVDPYTPSPPATSHSTNADIQSHNSTTNGHGHGQTNGSSTPSSSSTYLPSFSSHLGNNNGVGSLGNHLQNSPLSNGYSHSQQHHTNGNGHSSSYQSVVPKTEDDSFALQSAHAQSPHTQSSHGHFSPSLPTPMSGFNTEHGPSSASSQSAHSWNGMYTSERVAIQHR